MRHRVVLVAFVLALGLSAAAIPATMTRGLGDVALVGDLFSQAARPASLILGAALPITPEVK